MTITAAKFGQPPIGETDPVNVMVTGNNTTTVVPIDTGNRDYRKLQAWVDDGNTIEASD